MNATKLIVSLCSTAALVACSSQSATRAGPEATPVPMEGTTEAGVSRTRTGDADGLEKWTNINFSKKTPMTATLVYVDGETAKNCSMGDKEIFFAYDSAQVSGDAKKHLGMVADCLKKADSDVTVVGYADPRGTDSYNKDLGKSRAESVAEVLSTHGVAQSRIKTESKGEAGSVSNPAGWPTARRVEIRTGSAAMHDEDHDDDMSEG